MMGSSSVLANTQSHRLYAFLLPSTNVKGAKVRNLGFKVEIPQHASSFSVHQRKGNNRFAARCASWSLERELEADHEEEEEEEESITGIMARYRHKCGERKGVVELLECLEREAIMGEDVGKEPMDYNRRAQIFDTSSRVFQALKESNNTTVDAAISS